MIDNKANYEKVWTSPNPSSEDLFSYLWGSLNEIELAAGKCALVVGEGAMFHKIVDMITNVNVAYCDITHDIAGLLHEYNVGVVLTTYTDPENVHKLLQILYDSGNIGEIAFIYKIEQQRCYRVLADRGACTAERRYIDGNFPYAKFAEIFEESLAVCEHKTQIRDAFDFAWHLEKVKRIEGDILELGSFRGHSGYILSRFQEEVCRQQRSGLPKKVFLCDTFEGFPREDLAIDSRWNGTHDVDFEDVKSRFEGISNVEFVKGDIRRTLPGLVEQRRFSFVYVDLDSFSATEYALETIYPKVSSGGVIVCQDYGKEHCIGARLAVDNFVRRVRCFDFFSFFSGVKVIVKIEDRGYSIDNITENSGVLRYLAMQKSCMNDRANKAMIQKDKILNECVVGSWDMQERFDYDSHILKYFKKNPSASTILEYGCGPARNIRRLAPMFKRVDGVDVSGVCIKNAERFLGLNGISNYKLYETNGCDIPVEAHTYDLVFSVICFTHISCYTIRSHILKEMYRVLNKGGMLVIQFGFGINHDFCKKRGTAIVDYYADIFNAKGTNGVCDYYVECITQPMRDFEESGFKEIKTWFSEPSTSVAKHQKWLWCSGLKG